MNNVFYSPEFLVKLQALEQEKSRAEYAEKVEQPKYVPKVAPGTYPAITTKAEMERNAKSNFGINDKVIVTFTIFVTTPDNTQEGIELRQTYWKAKTDTSPYYQYLSQLLNADPRNGFSLKDLMGIPCEVVVTHNQGDKGTFANVSHIKKVNLSPSLDKFRV